MVETDKSTNPREPYSENIEADKTASEKMPEEAREKLKEVKKAKSEKDEKCSENWSETVQKKKYVAKKAGYMAKNAGAAAYESISENLLPMILTGIGTAWLVSSIMRSRSEPDYEADYTRGFYDEASDQPESTQSRVEDRAREIAERAQNLKERARKKSRRTKEKSWEFVTKNPFYAAGAAAAMGLLVGLVFPKTRGEQALLNDMRDELREG